MPTPRRAGHVPVRINPGKWGQEVERYRKDASPLLAAERKRRRLEREGIPILALARCSEEGAEGTSLDGLRKSTFRSVTRLRRSAPMGSSSSRPGKACWRWSPFGERHPAPETRSVYERAHKWLHGRCPDQ